MFMLSVSFAKVYKNMLALCKEMLEYRNVQVAIQPKHTKLITGVRYIICRREVRLLIVSQKQR